jgi:acetyltransferase-like isoleucine patch superfamily enzyme
VLDEIDSVCRTDQKVAEAFDIAPDVFNLAEYQKALTGGIDPDMFSALLEATGFEDVRTSFEWFAGQGKILHGVSASAADTIDAYLRQALPLSRGLYKYLRFVAVKPKVLVYGSRRRSVVRVLVEDCGHEFADYRRPSHRAGHSGSVRRGAAITSCRLHGCVTPSATAICEHAQLFHSGSSLPVIRCPARYPRAYVNTRSRLGDGCLVMAGAQIAEHVELGSGSVVWPGAVISHDSVLGPSVYLSPNCTICGCCRLGSCCFVGAGAVVVNHATVPDDTRIKALERHGVPQQ